MVPKSTHNNCYNRSFFTALYIALFVICGLSYSLMAAAANTERTYDLFSVINITPQEASKLSLRNLEKRADIISQEFNAIKQLFSGASKPPTREDIIERVRKNLECSSRDEMEPFIAYCDRHFPPAHKTIVRSYIINHTPIGVNKVNYCMQKEREIEEQVAESDKDTPAQWFKKTLAALAIKQIDKNEEFQTLIAEHEKEKHNFSAMAEDISNKIGETKKLAKDAAEFDRYCIEGDNKGEYHKLMNDQNYTAERKRCKALRSLFGRTVLGEKSDATEKKTAVSWSELPEIMFNVRIAEKKADPAEQPTQPIAPPAEDNNGDNLPADFETLIDQKRQDCQLDGPDGEYAQLLSKSEKKAYRKEHESKSPGSATAHYTKQRKKLDAQADTIIAKLTQDAEATHRSFNRSLSEIDAIIKEKCDIQKSQQSDKRIAQERKRYIRLMLIKQHVDAQDDTASNNQQEAESGEKKIGTWERVSNYCQPKLSYAWKWIRNAHDEDLEDMARAQTELLADARLRHIYTQVERAENSYLSAQNKVAMLQNQLELEEKNKRKFEEKIIKTSIDEDEEENRRKSKEKQEKIDEIKAQIEKAESEVERLADPEVLKQEVADARKRAEDEASRMEISVRPTAEHNQYTGKAWKEFAQNHKSWGEFWNISRNTMIGANLMMLFGEPIYYKLVTLRQKIRAIKFNHELTDEQKHNQIRKLSSWKNVVLGTFKRHPWKRLALLALLLWTERYHNHYQKINKKMDIWKAADAETNETGEAR